MKWLVLAVLLIAALLLWRVMRPTVRLRVGDLAPAFELSDQHGVIHTLTSYRGRWLVLYFYPRDDTPGCTREACQFRDAYASLCALPAEVLGVSVDPADTHARFAAKYQLPFAMLADTQGSVAARYGVLIKLGRWQFARRVSFIIAPDGRIAHIFANVKPARHANEVIAILKALQTTQRASSL